MLRINMVIIELSPILFTLPTSCIRAIIGERERSIIPQFGNHMSTDLSDHLPGIVMAKGTIKDKGDHLEAIADHLQ